MNGKQWIAALSMAVALSGAAALAQTPGEGADGVTRQCLDRHFPAEICACATARVSDLLPQSDFDLYERAGALLMPRLATGEDPGTAYAAILEVLLADLAMSEQALRELMGEYGNLHRDAVRDCGGEV